MINSHNKKNTHTQTQIERAGAKDTKKSPTEGNKEVNNIYFYLNIFCFHDSKKFLFENKGEN